MKVGVLGGGGSFAREFIPLFAAHPDVDEVTVAEIVPERREEMAARFGLRRTFASLEDLLASDVDAVAIFTQRWLHAPQAIAALRAGKHVYSAVPAGVTLDELRELVRTVEETGLVYSMGETSHYYPSAIWCREQHRKGAFGHMVYAEGEYIHDMSHGFEAAYANSGGPDYKRTTSFPPLLYPSHSVAMVLSVTGARLTHVSAVGYRDREDDGLFDASTSLWGNDLSGEVALFRADDGSMVRIAELRRVGVNHGPSVRLSLYGTKGSFEEQADARVFNEVGPALPVDLREVLRCAGDPDEDPARPRVGIDANFSVGLSSVHDRARIPASFAGLPNGHYGSHQFLVLDFVDAVVHGRRPPTDVWQAARYCVPGIVAHESARQGGVQLEVPDLGSAPA
ncbi:MAG TPA: Gfo/Idh/MocA family oxidoreductase [Candidatus Limnocylindrales bacterium]|nr:Gfo/Idh/MocA family oxidoreductase [Candidatus Limnocylindrales bacterium]